MSDHCGGLILYSRRILEDDPAVGPDLFPPIQRHPSYIQMRNCVAQGGDQFASRPHKQINRDEDTDTQTNGGRNIDIDSQRKTQTQITGGRHRNTDIWKKS